MVRGVISCGFDLPKQTLQCPALGFFVPKNDRWRIT